MVGVWKGAALWWDIRAGATDRTGWQACRGPVGIVFDAARAAVLRVMGYRCDAIEFVSPEHTGKNIMLRAERRSSKPLPGAVEDYAALKAAWRITPALERLVKRSTGG
jgi:hypothetical protein